MTELAGYDAAAWRDWHTAVAAHADLLRTHLPRHGHRLDLAHLPLDTVLWSAPAVAAAVWPAAGGDGEPGPDGWIEVTHVHAAQATVAELADLTARAPANPETAESLAGVRAAVAALAGTTRGRVRPVPVAPAPRRAVQDWSDLAAASSLLGGLAAVAATTGDQDLPAPHVQLSLRTDDDAFEVTYHLMHPAPGGTAQVSTSDPVGLPSLVVATYRAAEAMTAHTARTCRLDPDVVRAGAHAAQADHRWWVSADPTFTDLVHPLWDLCSGPVPVSLSWSGDGAWAVDDEVAGRVSSRGAPALGMELLRRRALARHGG